MFTFKAPKFKLKFARYANHVLSFQLAEIAQRWADQCTSEHDMVRKVNRFEVGQNIYETASILPASIDWLQVATEWFNQVNFASRNDVPKYKWELKTLPKFLYCSVLKLKCYQKIRCISQPCNLKLNNLSCPCELLSSLFYILTYFFINLSSIFLLRSSQ